MLGWRRRVRLGIFLLSDTGFCFSTVAAFAACRASYPSSLRGGAGTGGGTRRQFICSMALAPPQRSPDHVMVARPVTVRAGFLGYSVELTSTWLTKKHAADCHRAFFDHENLRLLWANVRSARSFLTFTNFETDGLAHHSGCGSRRLQRI